MVVILFLWVLVKAQLSLGWSVGPVTLVSCMLACVCVCARACVRMWVHLHLEYVPSLNWEGNQQQTGKGGEIPWALKSPGLSFPEACTASPQTGSLRLFPFHGSAAVEAPAALQVKCFPAPQ